MPPRNATAKGKVQAEAGPDAAEASRRLQSALHAGVLSESRSASSQELKPPSLLLKADGKDVVKKSSGRKGRFLLNIGAQIAPAAAGRMLDTKNPVMYVDFPEGRLKLFGTLCFPKNKYLSLKFGPKEVLCEDVFENMVVFAEAWWVGTKAENPEEKQLPMPPDLEQSKLHDEAECGFLDDAAPADKPSAGKRARPAAEADEGDGADDWGDTDTGDADQENADGAVDEALEGLASQRPQRIAAGRNGKRLRYNDDDDDDDEEGSSSSGEDTDAESGDSQPHRKVSEPSRDRKRQRVANGGAAPDDQRPVQKSDTAPPQRVTVQSSLNGFVKRPPGKAPAKPKAAAKPTASAAGDKGSGDEEDPIELSPAPAGRGRGTPRRVSAVNASRRLVVSASSNDEGGADSERSDDDEEDGSSFSGGSAEDA